MKVQVVRKGTQTIWPPSPLDMPLTYAPGRFADSFGMAHFALEGTVLDCSIPCSSQTHTETRVCCFLRRPWALTLEILLASRVQSR